MAPVFLTSADRSCLTDLRWAFLSPKISLRFPVASFRFQSRPVGFCIWGPVRKGARAGYVCARLKFHLDPTVIEYLLMNLTRVCIFKMIYLVQSLGIPLEPA